MSTIDGGQTDDGARPRGVGAGASTRDSVRRIFSPERGLLSGGATDWRHAQDRSLLRTRLLAVAILFASLGSLFLARSLLTDRLYIAGSLAEMAFMLGCAILLVWRTDWRLSHLRALEVLMFAAMTLHFVGANYAVATAMAGQGRDVMAMMGIYRTAMGIFALVVVYGLFVPNTARRAAMMIAPMVGSALALNVYFRLRLPGVGEALDRIGLAELGSFALLYLALGATAAILGAGVIDDARRKTLEAQAMGTYRLVERLGSGGMGEVWKAEHRMLVRPAAIKMIRADRSSGGARRELVRRFEREARATALLTSPHTIRLYDYGVAARGTFFYVMEYLEGLDLEAMVERFGPLPQERVLFLIRQAAESLAEAHQVGLVHGDIKPANLHVGRAGVRYDFLKVLDFGLVKPASDFDPGGGRRTGDGRVAGTPAYISPEVVLGDRPVDHRADLYSLGAVAYRLLTGRLLFARSTPMQMVVAHVKAPPPRPSEISETEVVAEVDELIFDCLQKDPDHRPESMAELVSRIDSADRSIATSWTQERAAAWWHLHLAERTHGILA